tara:strand:- start:465 stop:653 length:189 start_codon:yes stop_codon:yes gene_type:complete
MATQIQKLEARITKLESIVAKFTNEEFLTTLTKAVDSVLENYEGAEVEVRLASWAMGESNGR